MEPEIVSEIVVVHFIYNGQLRGGSIDSVRGFISGVTTSKNTQFGFENIIVTRTTMKQNENGSINHAQISSSQVVPIDATEFLALLDFRPHMTDKLWDAHFGLTKN
jgi:hypothetical protein